MNNAADCRVEPLPEQERQNEQARRDWRIPDEMWQAIQPLLPERKKHPLGCHRPRVNDRE